MPLRSQSFQLLSVKPQSDFSGHQQMPWPLWETKLAALSWHKLLVFLQSLGQDQMLPSALSSVVDRSPLTSMIRCALLYCSRQPCDDVQKALQRSEPPLSCHAC